MLIFFYLLCYASVLKYLTYYAQYGECSIRVYQVHDKYGECSIRVYRSSLIFLTKQFLLCWHYA